MKANDDKTNDNKMNNNSANTGNKATQGQSSPSSNNADEKQQNVDANARAAQTGVKAASTVAGAYFGGAAGAKIGSKVGDAINNSKIGQAATQGMGKVMEQANKTNPLGKQVQNATNKAAENGTFDKADKGIDMAASAAGGGAGGAGGVGAAGAGGVGAAGAGGAASSMSPKLGFGSNSAATKGAKSSGNLGTASNNNPSKAQNNKNFNQLKDNLESSDNEEENKDDSSSDDKSGQDNNQSEDNSKQIGKKKVKKSITIKLLIQGAIMVLPLILPFILLIVAIIAAVMAAASLFSLLPDNETKCMHVPDCSVVVLENGEKYSLDDYVNGAVYHYFGDYDNAEVLKAMALTVKTDLFYSAKIDAEISTCTITDYSDYPLVDVIEYDEDNTAETTADEKEAKTKYKEIVSKTNSVKNLTISGYDVGATLDKSVLDNPGLFDGYKGITKKYLTVPEEWDDDRWTIIDICEEEKECTTVNLCSDVVTESFGTIPLEDFVAGVVMHEGGGFQNIEYYKAHAILARSYVAGNYDNGSGVCEIPEADFVHVKIGYKPNTSELITQAVSETEGMVLMNGDKIQNEAEWDAFCWKEKNDNNYILYQHDQEIPTDWANNHVGNSDYLNNICQPESDTPSDGGHGRGMSQYGAYYMITEQGATYEYILSFYFPDSTISGGGSCGGENSNGFINSEGYTLPINMDVVSMIPGEYNGYCNNHIPTPPANPRADVHHAMDFTSPEGTPVYAAHDGVVTKLYFNPKKNCMSCPGNSSYGIGVQITNTDGTVANYAHFSECLASLNQEVKAGDIIGKVGETGSATGPHLHFDIAENGVRKDPRNYLPLEGVAVCYGH